MRTITIDLSTRFCGICDNGQTSVNEFWDKDYNLRIEKIVRWFANGNGKCDNLLIELANFRNAGLCAKFNRLLGNIEALFGQYNLLSNLKVKVFNANEWHRLIGIKNQDIRPICKLKSRLYAHEKTSNDKYIRPFTRLQLGEIIDKYDSKYEHKNEGWISEKMISGMEAYNQFCKSLDKWYGKTGWSVSDDESDAYCIWDLRDSLRDEQVIKHTTTQHKQQIAQGKISKLRQERQTAKKLLKLSNELNKYIGIDINSMPKSSQKRYERLKADYEQLKV